MVSARRGFAGRPRWRFEIFVETHSCSPTRNVARTMPESVTLALCRRRRTELLSSGTRIPYSVIRIGVSRPRRWTGRLPMRSDCPPGLRHKSEFREETFLAFRHTARSFESEPVTVIGIVIIVDLRKIHVGVQAVNPCR
jgi:hypothetical protein